MKKRFEIGLMIGNLVHKDASKNSNSIYPKKFSKLLNKMVTTKGSVILYSHFYHNGIFLFKEFLDEKGYQSQYAILDPDLSSEAFASIVERYNQGKIKFYSFIQKLLKVLRF